MITLVFLFVLGLGGWTASTLMSQGKHQEEIKNELGNIFDSFKDLSKSVHKLSVDELVTLRSEIDEAIFNKTVATWKY